MPHCGRPRWRNATPAVERGRANEPRARHPVDTAGVTVGGIPLPAFDVPDCRCGSTRHGTTQLAFNLNGDTIHARFAVRSSNVRWARDSSLTTTTIGNLIWQVVSGISNLDLEARVSGALHNPVLAVRSNLDQAIASRVRAVFGEQLAAAEKLVRARVDSLVDDKVTPVRARVTALQTQAQAQIAQQRGRIDELQKSLEDQLRNLTRGIRLP
jgi:hypothetical protein